jgi:hypothetical protein
VESTITDKKYELKIVFDKSRIDEKHLYENAEKLRISSEINIELTAGNTQEGHPVLTVNGDLECVNDFHLEISKTLFKKLQLKHFRLIDQAGDEIRQRAFPIIAEIEQDIRTFVNQSILEFDGLGFDWWETLREDIHVDDLLDQSIYHPLELLQFDDLIQIMTKEVSEWDKDKQITREDLIELLKDVTTIEELKASIQQKSTPFSFWNQVFAKKFEKDEDWKNFNDDLRWIIKLRHAVMHHRPVYLSELRLLAEKRAKLEVILSSPMRLVSKNEQSDIQRKTFSYRQYYASIIDETTKQSLSKKLRDQISSASNTEELLTILSAAQNYETQEKLTLDDSHEIQLQAFDALIRSTSDSSARAEEIIIGVLTPLCIQENEKQRKYLFRYREVLGQWIDHFPSDIADRIRNRIYSYLNSQISRKNPRQIFWLIGHLGYRDSNISMSLWNIVDNNDNDIGDEALSTMVTLGVEGSKLEKIREEALLRSGKRRNISLANILSSLAIPSSVNNVLKWLRKKNVNDFDSSLWLGVLSNIAEKNWQNTDLQDEIWRGLIAINRKDILGTRLFLGDVIPKINSKLIPNSVLDFISTTRVKNGWHRYLLNRRLAESIMPQQLLGFDQADINHSAFNKIKTDAKKDTKFDGYSTTSEWSIKWGAWELALRYQNLEFLAILPKAIECETGRFVQKEIFEILSCLKLDPIPEVISRLVTNKFDEEKENTDGREISRRVAAAKITCSAVTLQAFQALLKNGYTRGGTPIRSTSEFLAAIALSLVKSNKADILNELMDSIENREEPPQRTSAIFALEYVTSFTRSLNTGRTEKLEKLLFDQGLFPYDKQNVLRILGNVRDYKFSKYLIDKMIEWALQHRDAFGNACIEIMAEKGLLNQDIHTNILGLKLTKEGWHIDEAKDRQQFETYIIGLLFVDNPSNYLNAVTWLIHNSDWTSLYGLLTYLSDNIAKIVPYRSEIANSICERIVDKQTTAYGEISIFSNLAKIDNAALLNKRFFGVWNNWTSDAQVALIDQIGVQGYENIQKEDVLDFIEPFIHNQLFVLRRAAIRAVSRLSRERLLRLAIAFSREKATEFERTISAEIVGWLDSDLDEIKALQSQLLSDVSPKVRKAVDLSIHQQRDRDLASDYLYKILNVSGTENLETIGLWRYGEALKQLANDEIIEKLGGKLKNDQNLKPNVRNWYLNIYKGCIERWRKLTQEWPEPWISTSGAIENGKGKVWEKDGKSKEVDYTIWLDAQQSLKDTRGWGGLISLSNSFFLKDVDTIELTDGRKGKILMRNMFGANLIFTGTGEYPHL